VGSLLNPHVLMKGSTYEMTFACTALAAALIGIGSVALADDAMMKPAAMPAHMATMLCRAADGGEKATAMMGSKALVCKTIDMHAMMEMNRKWTNRVG